ncbi:MAG: DUF6873 family GME fold protein [Eubacteriales bacterium]
MKKIFVSRFAPPTALRNLSSLGYEVRALEPYPALAAPVASHADMLIFPAGERIITYEQYYRANPALFDGVEVRFAARRASARYPDDIALNALEYGGAVYSLDGHTDEKIIAYADAARRKRRCVAQGYARCSVLAFGGGCVTADTSMAAALRSDGADVLMISPGGIKLDGYPYGFIGGASACGVGRVMLFGDIALHPDGASAAGFIESRGAEVIALCGGELTDVGGAVII